MRNKEEAKMNYELLEALIQGKKEQFEQAADQIWGFAEMRYPDFPVKL